MLSDQGQVMNFICGRNAWNRMTTPSSGMLPECLYQKWNVKLFHIRHNEKETIDQDELFAKIYDRDEED